MIDINFRLTPKCGHSKWDKQCLWCASLHWVARSFIKFSQGDNNKLTQIQIMSYYDTTEASSLSGVSEKVIEYLIQDKINSR